MSNESLSPEELVIDRKYLMVGEIVAHSIFETNAHQISDGVMRIDEKGLKKICAFAVQTAFDAVDKQL